MPIEPHRSLNVAAVCFSSDMINDFSPEWTSIEHYRYWNGWNRFKTGEADQLVEKAYESVGAYPLRKAPKPSEQKRKSTAEPTTRWLKKKR